MAIQYVFNPFTSNFDAVNTASGGMLGSDWVAYTPTTTGWGTITSSTFFSRRVGDSLEVKGTFNAGTVTGSLASVSIGYNGTNANVTIDTAKMATVAEIIGGSTPGINGSGYFTTLAKSADNTSVYFGVQGAATSGLTPAAGNGLISNGAGWSFYGVVPISGWTWDT